MAPSDDVGHVIHVVQQIVPLGDSPDEGRMPILTPVDRADAIQRRCRVLDWLSGVVPSVVDGPVDLAAQYWIATGQRPDPQPVDRVFREERFVAINADALHIPTVKPFGCGLFTSTGLFDTPGMWRMYLRGYEDSSLYPDPSITWHVRPRHDVAVYEIDGATRWVELLDSYPRIHQGLVYPDWARIAELYDAIHVTLRAVVATQGISFAGRGGPTAPPFWDVETVWWLRWCFSSAEPVASGRAERQDPLAGSPAPARAVKPDIRTRPSPQGAGGPSAGGARVARAGGPR